MVELDLVVGTSPREDTVATNCHLTPASNVSSFDLRRGPATEEEKRIRALWLKPQLGMLLPRHSELAKGTLRAIIRQAGLTLEEFQELL